MYKDIVIDHKRLENLPDDEIVINEESSKEDHESDTELDYDLGPVDDDIKPEQMSSFIPFEKNSKMQKDLIDNFVNNVEIELEDIVYKFLHNKFANVPFQSFCV